jgi:hypothetical protein
MTISGVAHKTPRNAGEIVIHDDQGHPLYLGELQ